MSFFYGMWKANRPASVHCDEMGCKAFLAVPVKALAREESAKVGWSWLQTIDTNPQNWKDYCPEHAQ